ncbi:lytic transglycosylase domain-containing protein [Salinimicrobium oceani]|uniref:LysM peptidoglycan-binding domain-containing protein n=1 Tax=Salinimicrobium oceani TaxID=2722702 RepID=A0ABX1CUK3_9FLAO|nr:lytic transglycosylase domain-containing protein [Salinimicrobium oceani]NJW51985.1 LysM peptidoglycan-binding domain-containing protein [Salinimicrobium oceani]
MRKYLPLLILLLSVVATAQDVKTEAKNVEGQEKVKTGDTIKLPEQDFFMLLDSDDVDLANNVPVHKIIKDSLVFALLDDPGAALIDSLWQKELFESSLYLDLRDSLLDQEYNEVVFDELPTDTLKMRLQRLNAKTPFNVEYNPLLENVIKSYLKRNKKGMERLMALSTYYFPLFEQKLDIYNIPLEIKYLAIVESALNPRARSRVGATGLWQFMFATGKMHGLDVSSYVDERMDPVLSTEAAAQYLATLYRVFEDWDLVLASYNSGPGNVSKAIRRSGGSNNYWNLRPYLPRETAGYVPAFLATMYIFEYAEEHGFQPPNPRATYFETDTIHTKRMLTFEQISEVTGVEKEMLQFLNPSYKLDVIPHIDGVRYSLRLPRNRTGLFVNNEEAIYGYAAALEQKKEESLPQLVDSEAPIRYRVRRGDYLGKIAERHGVGVSQIKQWNSLRSNNLRIGQRLIIYPKSNTGTAANNNSPRIYTVKHGDSLWSISKKFPGVTVQRIKNLNNMNSNRLKPGMKLKLSDG